MELQLISETLLETREKIIICTLLCGGFRDIQKVEKKGKKGELR